MAHFSKSFKGTVFNDECGSCPLGEEPCPVAVVQGFYNRDACGNKVATKILNHLVKQGEDFEYIGCQMKPFVVSLANSSVVSLANMHAYEALTAERDKLREENIHLKEAFLSE